MSKHNKEYFDAFRKEVESAVANIAKRRNLKITAGNITLENERNFKLTLQIKEGDSKAAEAIERSKWDLDCKRYGLDPEDFGKTFIYHGTTYRATGIKPFAKCPILTDSDIQFSPELFLHLVREMKS
ncbi:hypothetical protein M0P65_07910 [Candidatus Gracilibacteria bacterium]|jgi:hypothetical protein|nr:hypothetical protein [Candidatus Gracilibacteria bacterium]